MKDKIWSNSTTTIVVVITFTIALLFMLLITSDSTVYGRKDYYRDHPNNSKSYEEWTQEREFVNKVKGNY